MYTSLPSYCIKIFMFIFEQFNGNNNFASKSSLYVQRHPDDIYSKNYFENRTYIGIFHPIRNYNTCRLYGHISYWTQPRWQPLNLWIYRLKILTIWLKKKTSKRILKISTKKLTTLRKT